MKFGKKQRKEQSVDETRHGFMLAEGMGAMLFYLIMLAAAGGLVYALLSGSKLSSAEQSLNTLRLNVKQLYSSASDYSGLSNAVAQKAGIVPQAINKSNGIKNDWNGDITLSPGTDPNTFEIEYKLISKDACTRFASYQAGSWVSVTVNGTVIPQDSGMVSSIANVVKDSNTIIFLSN